MCCFSSRGGGGALIAMVHSNLERTHTIIRDRSVRKTLCQKVCTALSPLLRTPADALSLRSDCCCVPRRVALIRPNIPIRSVFLPAYILPVFQLTSLPPHPVSVMKKKYEKESMEVD